MDLLSNVNFHHIPYMWSVSCIADAPLLLEKYVFDFGNGDYHSLNNFLASVDWTSCFSNKNVDTKVSIFYDILFTGINYYIPKKTIKSGSSYPIWFNRDLKNLCYQKRLAHFKYKLSGKLVDYLNFKSIRSRC